MITTRKELSEIIALEGKRYPKRSIIRRYLRELRVCEYYKNRSVWRVYNATFI